jgi:hypothetical protein
MKANLGWARFVHQKAIDRDRAVKGTDEVNGEGVGWSIFLTKIRKVKLLTFGTTQIRSVAS